MILYIYHGNVWKRALAHTTQAKDMIPDAKITNKYCSLIIQRLQIYYGKAKSLWFCSVLDHIPLLLQIFHCHYLEGKLTNYHGIFTAFPPSPNTTRA